MKIVVLILLMVGVSILAEAGQQLPCCRSPNRVFDDDLYVNLTPLFKWWTNQQDGVSVSAFTLRPLSSWKRITGTKTKDLSFAWMLDATVFTSPTVQTNEQIILQRPPKNQENEFDTLKSQVAQLAEQVTNAMKSYQADIKTEDRAQARYDAASRSWRWKGRLDASVYSQQTTEERDAANAALNEQKQYQSELDAAKSQLSAFSNSDGKFKIDCFALETGRIYEGLPVYDTGFSSDEN